MSGAAHRARWPAVVGLVAGLPLVGCGTDDAPEPVSSPDAADTAEVVEAVPAGSCAITLEVDGRSYEAGPRPERRPDLTGRVVAAVIPPCPGPEQDGVYDGPFMSGVPTRAAEIAGLRVADAVWWHGHVLVRAGVLLPSGALDPVG